MIKDLINKHRITKKLYEDSFFRTIGFTVVSFLLNIIYAAAYAAMGYIKHSPWHGTLAAYYIFLSIMRFLVLILTQRVPKKPQKADRVRMIWREYLVTGILLFTATVIFTGFEIILIHGEGGKSYPGMFIYVMCIYTFYKIITAVMNLFRVRKQWDPLMSIIRHIGQADALFSVLSLQTAMLAAFSDGDSLAFTTRMNGITGGIVCLIVLYLGVSMTIRALAELKKLRSYRR